MVSACAVDPHDVCGSGRHESIALQTAAKPVVQTARMAHFWTIRSRPETSANI
jgi:hypothetical protein